MNNKILYIKDLQKSLGIYVINFTKKNQKIFLQSQVQMAKVLLLIFIRYFLKIIFPQLLLEHLELKHKILKKLI